MGPPMIWRTSKLPARCAVKLRPGWTGGWRWFEVANSTKPDVMAKVYYRFITSGRAVEYLTETSSVLQAKCAFKYRDAARF